MNRRLLKVSMKAFDLNWNEGSNNLCRSIGGGASPSASGSSSHGTATPGTGEGPKSGLEKAPPLVKKSSAAERSRSGLPESWQRGSKSFTKASTADEAAFTDTGFKPTSSARALKSFTAARRAMPLALERACRARAAIFALGGMGAMLGSHAAIALGPEN